MSASVQWHSGTLRLWPRGSEPWSPTFDWACGIVSNPADMRTVALVGAMSAPPIDRLREIGQALLDAGFHFVEWERHSRGTTRWVRFDIKKMLSGKDVLE